MNQDEKENKILEITEKMIIALENPNLMMTRDQKEKLETFNESLLFFLDQGDWDRAIQEGERIVEIIEELDEDISE
jgi:hypothetical protein